MQVRGYHGDPNEPLAAATSERKISQPGGVDIRGRESNIFLSFFILRENGIDGVQLQPQH